MSGRHQPWWDYVNPLNPHCASAYLTVGTALLLAGELLWWLA